MNRSGSLLTRRGLAARLHGACDAQLTSGLWPWEELLPSEMDYDRLIELAGDLRQAEVAEPDVARDQRGQERLQTLLSRRADMLGWRIDSPNGDQRLHLSDLYLMVAEKEIASRVLGCEAPTAERRFLQVVDVELQAMAVRDEPLDSASRRAPSVRSRSAAGLRSTGISRAACLCRSTKTSI